MRLFILSAITAVVVSSCENSGCNNISEEYSLELEATIKADNERRWEQVGYSYGRYDQALALHMATGFVANIDSVGPNVFLLKDNCFKFRSDFDEVLRYPLDGTTVDTLQQMLNDFTLMIFNLIEDNFRKEYLIHDVYSVLDPMLIDNLSGLCENEFCVEKELFKGRLIEVEYMAVETLLSELDYTDKISR